MGFSTSASQNRAWALGHVAKRLAGPFAASLAQVLADPASECEFLVASWRRQHALLAALDGPVTTPPEALRATFQQGDASDLINLAYGTSPPGLTTIFRKLADQRPAGRGGYRRLVELLIEGGHGAKLLRHHAMPDFHMVDFLAVLPDWARHSKAMNLNETSLRTLVQLGEVLRQSGRISTQALSDIIRGRPSERHPAAVLAKAGLDMRLPEPPIPGNDRLRPIRSSLQLLALARLFENCLESRLTDALSGAAAYYVWLGPEPLVVELRLADGLWWRFSEVNGYRNLTPLADTEAQIAAEFGLETLNRRRLAELTK